MRKFAGKCDSCGKTKTSHNFVIETVQKTDGVMKMIISWRSGWTAVLAKGKNLKQ